MKPEQPPHEGYPGGSPFPPGKEPKLRGIIKLFVAAGGDIEWTQITMTPTDPLTSQPIRVSCKGCDYGMIGPAAELQLQVLQPGSKARGMGGTIRLKGTATLEILLHQNLHDETFAWPHVQVIYRRGDKVVGVTSWSPPPDGY